MAKRGSSEFINLTLTEFLMVIIFILITLLFYTFKKNKPESTDIELTPRQIAQIESNATRFNKELFHSNSTSGGPKEQIFEFIDKMEEVLAVPDFQNLVTKTPLPEFWDTLEAKKQKEAELQAEIDELTQAIGNDDDRKTIQKLVKEKGRLTKEIIQLKQKHAKYEALHKEFNTTTPEELDSAVMNQKGQLADLSKRAKENGVGDPLCWVEKGGEKEFIFFISILESGLFEVAPIYPPHRKKDLLALGYPHLNKSVSLSVQSFKRLMQRFWNYGQSHNHCRFFVKVKDETKSKERWKYGLALVENYFYKQEVR